MQFSTLLMAGFIGIMLPSQTSFLLRLAQGSKCPSQIQLLARLLFRLLICLVIQPLIMMSGLHFNICNLPSSFLLDSEVPNLQVDDKICDSLRYACQYWAEHMAHAAPSEHKALQAHIVDFLHTHVLFWIEAMNLLQMSSQCARMLLEVRDCIRKVRKTISLIYF